MPKTIHVQLGDDLLAAVQRHAERRGLTVADVVRAALAREVRRPQLAGAVKRGRPRLRGAE